MGDVGQLDHQSLSQGLQAGVGQRLDLSLSTSGKLAAWSAMSELILSAEGGQIALSAAGEIGLLATDRLLLFGRADDDIEIHRWSAGGGASWFVTPDRWNKVSLYAWVRRHHPDDRPDADGAVVQLQAAL